MTSTEHPAPSSKRRRGSAIHQWRGPPVNANANGTGWANQLTCSLVQLSRSTRGCASTEAGGQRSKVGQRRNGTLGEESSRHDRDEDEGDGGRRGFRHLIPELVRDAECCSCHPPSIWGKGVASSLLDNGHGAIVEESEHEEDVTSH